MTSSGTDEDITVGGVKPNVSRESPSSLRRSLIHRHPSTELLSGKQERGRKRVDGSSEVLRERERKRREEFPHPQKEALLPSRGVFCLCVHTNTHASALTSASVHRRAPLSSPRQRFKDPTPLFDSGFFWKEDNEDEGGDMTFKERREHEEGEGRRK